MALELIWTAGAERDLLEIHDGLFDTLEGDDEIIARILRRPLHSALTLLQQHPEAGAKVKQTQRLRRWLLGPQRRYALFYAIEKRGILIHALLDLRQDPSAIWKRLQGY